MTAQIVQLKYFTLASWSGSWPPKQLSHAFTNAESCGSASHDITALPCSHREQHCVHLLVPVTLRHTLTTPSATNKMAFAHIELHAKHYKNNISGDVTISKDTPALSFGPHLHGYYHFICEASAAGVPEEARHKFHTAAVHETGIQWHTCYSPAPF